MAITQFENDGPDEDGDVSVDFTMKLRTKVAKKSAL